MKSTSKAVLFILISFLCGIWVVQFYLPPPWFNATHLLFFEFPPFSPSKLIRITCILLVGVFLGAIARKYATKAESNLQRKLATVSIFLNAIILILPVLNLVSLFIPRTITRVVELKGYDFICVEEIEAQNSWSQEVVFDGDTVVYEQGQKVNQHKTTASIDAIQPGQVVEIRYIDNDDVPFRGIKALSITILKGQYRPYKNKYCSSSLP